MHFINCLNYTIANKRVNNVDLGSPFGRIYHDFIVHTSTESGKAV